MFISRPVFPLPSPLPVETGLRWLQQLGGDNVGWFKNPVSSQIEKLMAATNFFDYLGLKHYKKAKKIKTLHPFSLAYGPQSINFLTFL